MRTKRAVVWMLALAMVLAMLPAAALAAEPDKNTDVNANVSPAYTITVPAKVEFNNLTKGTGVKSRNFWVKASNVVLEDGASIDVTAKGDAPDGRFLLYDGSGLNALNYVLNNGTAPVGVNGLYYSFTQDHRADGTVQVNTDDIQYAGAYSGAMLFTIGYVDPPAVNAAYDTEISYLFGWNNMGGGTYLSVEMGFKNWTVNQLSAVEVSLLKNGKKIAVNKLNNPSEYGGKELTCPFYFDRHAPGAWDSEFLTSSFTGASADTIRLKVVKGGKTYFFHTANIGPYVAG